MLVTFSTSAYADITMFGDAALTLLKMMGHSGTVPSAIVAADIPTALSRLNAALQAEKALPEAAVDDEDDAAVSIIDRARPLIELLTAAQKEGADVMWK